MLRSVLIKRAEALAGIAAVDPAIETNRRVAPLALDSATRDTAARIDTAILANSSIGASIDTASAAATPYTLERHVVAIYLLANDQLAEVEHRA